MEDIKILDINSISEEQLPSIIASQFDALTELDNDVQKAVTMAEQAKQKATEAQVSAGWGKKKIAIELLQDVTTYLAEAQITATDAQKKSFEYQSKLAEMTKFLFGLGVSNIAMNRTVVKELELKLKGATAEGMSESAKRELYNVVMQLKEQEDIQKKQADLNKKVKEHHRQLKNLEEETQKQNEKLTKNVTTLNKHEKTLSEQQKKDTEIEKRTQKNEDNIISLQNEVQKQNQVFNKEIHMLKVNVENNFEETNKSINKLSASLNTEFENSKENIDALGKSFQIKIDEMQKNYNRKISDIKTETENKIIELSENLEKLQYKINKMGWKIVISTIAVSSLIFNIMQLIGIF